MDRTFFGQSLRRNAHFARALHDMVSLVSGTAVQMGWTYLQCGHHTLQRRHAVPVTRARPAYAQLMWFLAHLVHHRCRVAEEDLGQDWRRHSICGPVAHKREPEL